MWFVRWDIRLSIHAREGTLYGATHKPTVYSRVGIQTQTRPLKSKVSVLLLAPTCQDVEGVMVKNILGKKAFPRHDLPICLEREPQTKKPFHFDSGLLKQYVFYFTFVSGSRLICTYAYFFI